MKFIQSKYKAHWKGIVLDHINYKKRDIYVCLIIYDRHNNLMKRKHIKTLDSAWTVEIKPFDISNINPNWFRRDYILDEN